MAVDVPGRSLLRWGRAARVAVIALLAVSFLVLFVFPTRSFIAQRGQIADARRDLEVIREQNARLEEELARLSDPEEIEALARSQHQMVYPGEQAYSVIPAPPRTTTAPTTTPAPTTAPAPTTTAP